MVDRNDEAVRLMRQYLSHALQPLSYVSVPLARGDDTEDSADEFFLGEPAEMVFQALGLESRSVLVPCYEDKLKESLLMSAMVQRVHVWQSRGQGLGRALEIYNLEDPMEIDILRLVGFAVDRQKILTWAVEASDVEGCLTLKGPSVAKPLMALQSPNVPCLTLMDELARQGFRAVQRSVAHAVGAEMVFDARRADSQRCYFQCVLGRAAIWEKAAPLFRSGKSHAYYMLLLHSREPVDEAMSARDCKKKLKALRDGLPVSAPAVQGLPKRLRLTDGPPTVMLAISDGGVEGDDGVEAPPRAPLPSRKLPQASSGAAAASSGSTLALGAADAVAAAHAAAPPISTSTSSRSSSADSSSSASSSGASTSSSRNSSLDCGRAQDVDGGPEEIEYAIPKFIRGVAVRTEMHRQRKDSHKGLRVACANVGHLNCSRFRSLRIWSEQFGANAAAMYLDLWLSKSDSMTTKEHKAWYPTKRDLMEFTKSR